MYELQCPPTSGKQKQLPGPDAVGNFFYLCNLLHTADCSDLIPTADPGRIIHGSDGLFELVYTFCQCVVSESFCSLHAVVKVE